MKITIFTFQFAHNYGALLQAFALKDYLQSLGHQVNLVPYYPEWAQAEYAISPLAKGVPPRRRVRLALQYPRRKKQSQMFNKFISEDLNAGKTFSSKDDLIEWLNDHECVICGSDQIWNSKITGNGNDYFASGAKIMKVAYAASLGTSCLTNEQKGNIQHYLPEFSAVSVREPSSATAIEEMLNIKVDVVLDPVFLVDETRWANFGRSVDVKKKYLFLYFLQENEKLLKYAKEYAKKNGLIIYDVHPTMSRRHDGCVRINNVGPKEFIWLIQNAECICTNSFHATAFSTIFKKKLIHIPNSKSPERTVSLLARVGIQLKSSDEFPVYDLSLSNRCNLKEEIQKSKDFINTALQGD